VNKHSASVGSGGPVTSTGTHCLCRILVTNCIDISCFCLPVESHNNKWHLEVKVNTVYSVPTVSVMLCNQKTVGFPECV